MEIAERNKIFADNEKLVTYIVNIYRKGISDWDDLMQEGSLAMLRAIELYNPNSKIKFSTYAARAIRHRIGRFQRGDHLVHIPENVLLTKQESDAKVKERVEMFRKIGSLNAKTDKGTELVDFAEDTQTNIDDKIAVEQAMENLDEREKRYIIAKYYQDKSPKELVDMFGISRQRLNIIERKALKKMREALCE